MSLSLFIEQLQELERQGCGHYKVLVELPRGLHQPRAYKEVKEVEKTYSQTVIIQPAV